MTAPKAPPTVIVTRPEEDAAAFVRDLETRGCRVLSAPLLGIRFLEDAEIPPLAYQAVAITSANGARALARLPEMAGLRKAVAVVVGPASEAAARAAGFSRVLRAARGDVTGVIDAIRAHLDPSAGAVLYASGAVTRGDLQAELERDGFAVHRAVLYEAVPATSLPAPVAAHLRAGEPAWVTLFSPRTARIWTEVVATEGLREAAAALDHACLSENVRKALLAGLAVTGRITVAERPDRRALLAAMGLA
jgi:uroporphyrinogen-III synthase